MLYRKEQQKAHIPAPSTLRVCMHVAVGPLSLLMVNASDDVHWARTHPSLGFPLGGFSGW
jgi:hypothetical protein